jgi:2-oxoglutarate/2-oxoacid ferredoxin oxidoreductase subunit beta
MTTTEPPPKLDRKDFVTPNDVRWCPGCGDYAILNSLQRTFPELGIPREKFVVVSGIGCSSRFPYYMNTYGFHTIHGRAPAVATGIKLANPELSVWLITGDGDGLSIGGNHLLHILRRNPDITILLFNNRIYGLTKGQYSPTSPEDQCTKTNPLGSPEHPVNPLRFAISAEATFAARTVDNNVKHMVATFQAAAEHRGVSFVEILQNCVIFNNGTFDPVYGKATRAEQLLFLEPGQPMRFGKDGEKGLRLKGFTPEVVTIGEGGITEADLLVHDPAEPGPAYASILADMAYPDLPTAIGILRRVEGCATYEERIAGHIAQAVATRGRGDLRKLLIGESSWVVD